MKAQLTIEMGINIENERLFPIKDAPSVTEDITGCRCPHRCTILRWIVNGVRGRRLEAVRIGGHWHTSREALIRFFTSDGPNGPSGEGLAASPHPRPPTDGAPARVIQKLEAAGL